MGVSSAVIDQIRQQSSIEDIVSQVVSLVPARQNGKMKGLCPFHQEDTPSFTVDTIKNLFYCFGCQEGGDVFGFVQKTRGIGFIEAVRDLANDCGISLREQTPEEVKRFKKIDSLYEVCQLAADYFHRELNLSANGKKAKEYLEKRGLNDTVIRDFGLGYASPSSDDFVNYMHRHQVDIQLLIDSGLARYRDQNQQSKGVYAMFRNRLMIPIHNQRGKIVAFGGRRMPDDERSPAKYINSPETAIYKKSQVLYGLSFARSSIQRKKRVIIVEGYFDVIAMHMNGFKEAIASCGTALTPEHVKILRPLTRRAVAMFDMDEAGIRAAEKSLPLFWKAGIEPLRVGLGDAKDPDEYFMNHSQEDFEALLEKMEPLFITKLNNLLSNIGDSPGAIQEIIEEVSDVLTQMPLVARDASISLMASRLGVMASSIRSQLSSGTHRQQIQTHADPERLFSTRLVHLLWLLLHHPFKVRGYLENIEDPSIFSNEQEILLIMAMLMEGHSFDAVISEVSSEHLRKLLFSLTMKDDICAVENVELATKEIIARYQIDRLLGRLRNVQSEIALFSSENQFNLVKEKLSELQDIRSQYEDLQKQVLKYK